MKELFYVYYPIGLKCAMCGVSIHLYIHMLKSKIIIKIHCVTFPNFSFTWAVGVTSLIFSKFDLYMIYHTLTFVLNLVSEAFITAQTDR